jgi:hypothetical protein
MNDELDMIGKQFDAVSHSDAIMAPLRTFLCPWTTVEGVNVPLNDGVRTFMSALTGFYFRGVVERTQFGKMLFPAQRP